MAMKNTIQKVMGTLWIGVFGLVVVLLSLHGTSVLNAESNDGDGLCFNGNSGSIPPSNPSTQITVTEDTTVFPTYAIRLCKKPSKEVVLTSRIEPITASTQISETPTTLTFNTTNWSTPQAVTVYPWDDDDAESQQVVQIRYGATSADSNFNWQHAQGHWAQITIMDDDSGPITHTVYLPLIAKMPPPPTWQRVSADNLDVDVVSVHIGSLFLGEVSNTPSKGVYRATECKADSSFTHVSDKMRVLDFYFSDSIALLGSRGNQAFHSKPDGSNWIGTATTSMNPFVYAVAKAKNVNKSFAGADDGVYVSENNDGNSTTGMAWTLINGSPKVINAFRYDNSDTIWIATFGNGAFKYTIGNNTFTQLSNGLSGSALQVWDVAIRNSTEIYIATTAGVYKGDGNGAWQKFVNAGSEIDTQIYSLELANNILYAGTSNGKGIWMRDLAGSSGWTKLASQPTATIIRDLYFDSTNLCKGGSENRNGLLAATDKGLWLYR